MALNNPEQVKAFLTSNSPVVEEPPVDSPSVNNTVQAIKANMLMANQHIRGATTHSAKSANLPALKASSLERVIDNKYRPKPVIDRAFIERNLSPIQGTTPEHMFNREVQGDTIRGWDTDQVTAIQKIDNAIPKSFVKENDVFRAIDTAAEEFGLPKALFRSLIKQESGGKQDVTSRTAVRGIAQVTGPTMQEKLPGGDVNNMSHQLYAGAKHLANDIRRFKAKGFSDKQAKQLATMAYNTGYKRVKNAVNKARKETGDTHPSMEAIEEAGKELYPIPERKTVKGKEVAIPKDKWKIQEHKDFIANSWRESIKHWRNIHHDGKDNYKDDPPFGGFVTQKPPVDTAEDITTPTSDQTNKPLDLTGQTATTGPQNLGATLDTVTANIPVTDRRGTEDTKKRVDKLQKRLPKEEDTVKEEPLHKLPHLKEHSPHPKVPTIFDRLTDRKDEVVEVDPKEDPYFEQKEETVTKPIQPEEAVVADLLSEDKSDIVSDYPNIQEKYDTTQEETFRPRMNEGIYDTYSSPVADTYADLYSTYRTPVSEVYEELYKTPDFSPKSPIVAIRGNLLELANGSYRLLTQDGQWMPFSDKIEAQIYQAYDLADYQAKLIDAPEESEASGLYNKLIGGFARPVADLFQGFVGATTLVEHIDDYNNKLKAGNFLAPLTHDETAIITNDDKVKFLTIQNSKTTLSDELQSFKDSDKYKIIEELNEAVKVNLEQEAKIDEFAKAWEDKHPYNRKYIASAMAAMHLIAKEHGNAAAALELLKEYKATLALQGLDSFAYTGALLIGNFPVQLAMLTGLARGRAKRNISTYVKEHGEEALTPEILWDIKAYSTLQEVSEKVSAGYSFKVLSKIPGLGGLNAWGSSISTGITKMVHPTVRKLGDVVFAVPKAGVSEFAQGTVNALLEERALKGDWGKVDVGKAAVEGGIPEALALGTLAPASALTGTMYKLGEKGVKKALDPTGQKAIDKMNEESRANIEKKLKPYKDALEKLEKYKNAPSDLNSKVEALRDQIQELQATYEELERVQETSTVLRSKSGAPQQIETSDTLLKKLYKPYAQLVNDGTMTVSEALENITDEVESQLTARLDQQTELEEQLPDPFTFNDSIVDPKQVEGPAQNLANKLQETERAINSINEQTDKEIDAIQKNKELSKAQKQELIQIKEQRRREAVELRSKTQQEAIARLDQPIRERNDLIAVERQLKAQIEIFEDLLKNKSYEMEQKEDGKPFFRDENQFNIDTKNGGVFPSNKISDDELTAKITLIKSFRKTATPEDEESLLNFDPTDTFGVGDFITVKPDYTNEDLAGKRFTIERILDVQTRDGKIHVALEGQSETIPIDAIERINTKARKAFAEEEHSTQVELQGLAARDLTDEQVERVKQELDQEISNLETKLGKSRKVFRSSRNGFEQIDKLTEDELEEELNNASSKEDKEYLQIKLLHKKEQNRREAKDKSDDEIKDIEEVHNDVLEGTSTRWKGLHTYFQEYMEVLKEFAADPNDSVEEAATKKIKRDKKQNQILTNLKTHFQNLTAKSEAFKEALTKTASDGKVIAVIGRRAQPGTANRQMIYEVAEVDAADVKTNRDSTNPKTFRTYKDPQTGEIRTGVYMTQINKKSSRLLATLEGERQYGLYIGKVIGDYQNTSMAKTHQRQANNLKTHEEILSRLKQARASLKVVIKPITEESLKDEPVPELTQQDLEAKLAEIDKIGREKFNDKNNKPRDDLNEEQEEERKQLRKERAIIQAQLADLREAEKGKQSDVPPKDEVPEGTDDVSSKSDTATAETTGQDRTDEAEETEPGKESTFEEQDEQLGLFPNFFEAAKTKFNSIVTTSMVSLDKLVNSIHYQLGLLGAKFTDLVSFERSLESHISNLNDEAFTDVESLVTALTGLGVTQQSAIILANRYFTFKDRYSQIIHNELKPTDIVKWVTDSATGKTKVNDAGEARVFELVKFNVAGPNQVTKDGKPVDPKSYAKDGEYTVIREVGTDTEILAPTLELVNVKHYSLTEPLTLLLKDDLINGNNQGRLPDQVVFTLMLTAMTFRHRHPNNNRWATGQSRSWAQSNFLYGGTREKISSNEEANLNDLGYGYQEEARIAGRDAIKILALKAKKATPDSSITQAGIDEYFDALSTALGIMALEIGGGDVNDINSGLDSTAYFELHGKKWNFNNYKEDRVHNNFAEGSKEVYRHIKVIEEDENNKSWDESDFTALDEVLEANKSEVDTKPGPLQKPAPVKRTNIEGTNTKTSNQEHRFHKKANKTPASKLTSMDLVSDLRENRELLEELMDIEALSVDVEDGTIDPETGQVMQRDLWHISEMESRRARNQDKLDTLEELLAAYDKGELDQFFFDHKFQVQKRVLELGRLNPQNSKVVRALVSKWGLKEFSVDDQQSFVYFRLAVAQAFEIKIDKQELQNSLNDFNNILEDQSVLEAIEVTQRLAAIKTKLQATPKDRALLRQKKQAVSDLVRAVKKVKLAYPTTDLNLLNGINALAQYAVIDVEKKTKMGIPHKGKPNNFTLAGNNKQFMSDIGVESDGKSNGWAINVFQFPMWETEEELVKRLEQVGVTFDGEPASITGESVYDDLVKYVQEGMTPDEAWIWYTNNHFKDHVSKTTFPKNRYIDDDLVEIGEDYPKDTEGEKLFKAEFKILNAALDIIYPDFKDPKALRDIAKYPLIMKMYGSGMANVSGELADDMVKDIYKRISIISNEYRDQKQALEGLSPEQTKQKAQYTVLQDKTTEDIITLFQSLWDIGAFGATNQLDPIKIQDLFGKVPEETSVPFNIWAGNNENAILSNLANRPFVVNGKRYESVEHAYQTWKSGTFDENTYNKAWGKNNKITGNKKAKTTDNWNLRLMKRIIKKSLEANTPESKAALKLLEKSVGSPITHIGGKSDIWTKEFPRILTELRSELFGEERLRSDIPAFLTKVTNRKGVPDAKQYAKEDLTNRIYTLRIFNSNTIPGLTESKHFGNPWASRKIKGTIKTDDITIAVKNYKDWLEGTAHKDIEPERRAWIRKQIDDGNLDDKELVYYTTLSEPSHADVLAEYVKNRRTKVYASQLENFKTFKNLFLNGSEIQTTSPLFSHNFDENTVHGALQTVIAPRFETGLDTLLGPTKEPRETIVEMGEVIHFSFMEALEEAYAKKVDEVNAEILQDTVDPTSVQEVTHGKQVYRVTPDNIVTNVKTGNKLGKTPFANRIVLLAAIQRGTAVRVKLKNQKLIVGRDPKSKEFTVFSESTGRNITDSKVIQTNFASIQQDATELFAEINYQPNKRSLTKQEFIDLVNDENSELRKFYPQITGPLATELENGTILGGIDLTKTQYKTKSDKDSMGIKERQIEVNIRERNANKILIKSSRPSQITFTPSGVAALIRNIINIDAAALIQTLNGNPDIVIPETGTRSAGNMQVTPQHDGVTVSAKDAPKLIADYNANLDYFVRNHSVMQAVLDQMLASLEGHRKKDMADERSLQLTPKAQKALDKSKALTREAIDILDQIKPGVKRQKVTRYGRTRWELVFDRYVNPEGQTIDTKTLNDKLNKFITKHGLDREKVEMNFDNAKINAPETRIDQLKRKLYTSRGLNNHITDYFHKKTTLNEVEQKSKDINDVVNTKRAKLFELMDRRNGKFENMTPYMPFQQSENTSDIGISGNKPISKQPSIQEIIEAEKESREKQDRPSTTMGEAFVSAKEFNDAVDRARGQQQELFPDLMSDIQNEIEKRGFNSLKGYKYVRQTKQEGHITDASKARLLFNKFEAESTKYYTNSTDMENHTSHLSEVMKLLSEGFETTKNIEVIREDIDGMTQGEYVDAAEKTLTMSISQGTPKTRTGQSPQEVYVHELVHAMTWIAIDNSSIIADRLEALHNELEAKLAKDFNNQGWRVFLPPGTGPTNLATEEEIAEAKELYAHAFSEKEDIKLHEFIAFAMTSPQLTAYMKRTQIDENRVYLVNKFMQFIQDVINTIKKILNYNVYEAKTNTAYAEAIAITEALVSIQNKHNNKYDILKSKTRRFLTQTDAKIRDYATAVAENAAIKTYRDDFWLDKHRNMSFEEQLRELPRTASILPYMYFSDSTVAKELRDIGMSTLNFTLRGIAKELGSGALDNPKLVEQLLQSRVNIAKSRRQAELFTNEWFDNIWKSRDPEDKHWMPLETREALTNVILQADLSSLHYFAIPSLKLKTRDIMDLLGEDRNARNKRQNLKNKLLTEINASDSTQTIGADHLAIKYAEELGDFIATGKTRKLANSRMNAASITYSYLNASDPAQQNDQIALLDAYASLIAIDSLNTKSKKIVKDLADKEFFVSTKDNGFIALMENHINYKLKSRRDLFEGDPIQMVKGYIVERVDNLTDIQLGKAEDKERMEKLGYKDSYPLGKIDKNQTFDTLYINRNIPEVADVSGIMGTTGQRNMGTTLTEVLIQNPDYLHPGTGQPDFARIKAKINNFAKYQDDLVKQGTIDKRFAFRPVMDQQNRITDYRIMMDHQSVKELIRPDLDISNVLAHMESSYVDRKNTIVNDKKTIDLLLYEQATLQKSHPELFVDILDPENRFYDRYKKLPEPIREYITDYSENGTFMVREDIVDKVFGYKQFDLSQLKIFEGDGYLTQLSKQLAGLFHYFLRQTVAYGKSRIVLTMPNVVFGNMRSNIFQLLMRKIPLSYIFNKTFEGLNEYQKYKQHNVEYAKLLHTIDTKRLDRKKSPEAIQARKLFGKIQKNRLHKMNEAGLDSLIAEDVNEAQIDGYWNRLKRTAFQGEYQKWGDKVPESLQTVASWVMMTKGSPPLQVAQKTVQLTDFMGRYVMMEHDQHVLGKSFNASMHDALDAFVLFDEALIPALEALDVVGATAFLSYYLRNTRASRNLIQTSPTAVGISAAIQHATGVPTLANINSAWLGGDFAPNAFQTFNLVDEADNLTAFETVADFANAF